MTPDLRFATLLKTKRNHNQMIWLGGISKCMPLKYIMIQVQADSTGAEVDNLVSNKNEIEIIKVPPVI